VDSGLTSWRWRHAAARHVERYGPGLLVAAALGLWELLARTEWISPTFFPPPSSIAAALVEAVRHGDLAGHASVTIVRVLAGFALGAGPGLLLGLAMGASSRLRAQLDPLVAAAHPIPKIAVLPLILVIFGIGEASKVVLAAVGAFFPMAINTMAGVRQISPIHFEVARSYGASKLRLFTRVVLPGSLPFALAGARLSLNVALMLTIAGELVAAQRGLGQMLWFAWQTFRIEEVYAGLLVISVIGIGLNGILGRFAVWVMPWHADSPSSEVRHSS
jgi:ABC-type nitrate/sulfonate/bicarbonate transport system permease component